MKKNRLVKSCVYLAVDPVGREAAEGGAVGVLVPRVVGVKPPSEHEVTEDLVASSCSWNKSKTCADYLLIKKS